MKLSLLTLVGVICSTAAFVPSGTKCSNPIQLKMSEEAVAAVEAVAEVEEPEDVTPSAPIKEKVPCFGATPLTGGTFFLGEHVWDKLTSDIGSAETGNYIRAAELKHGRAAMLGTVGFAFHKLGITFDKITPHEYLSVTQNVKFADLAAMTPLDAMKSLPALGTWQIFTFIAFIEIYELTHKDGKFVSATDGLANGLKAGGLTGDLKYNPLNIEITDRRRLSELQNGRAAMFAICAWIVADAIPGAFPIPLPWN